MLSGCSLLHSIAGGNSSSSPETSSNLNSNETTSLVTNIVGTWEVTYSTGAKDVWEIAQNGPYIVIVCPANPFPLATGYIDGHYVMITWSNPPTYGFIAYGNVSSDAKKMSGTYYTITASKVSTSTLNKYSFLKKGCKYLGGFTGFQAQWTAVKVSNSWENDLKFYK